MDIWQICVSWEEEERNPFGWRSLCHVGLVLVKEKSDWINAAGKKLLLLLEMRKSKNIVQH